MRPWNAMNRGCFLQSCNPPFRFRAKPRCTYYRPAGTPPTRFPQLLPYFPRSSNVLPLRRSSNVNKVFGACAVAGSFAANHTDLSARAHATSIPNANTPSPFLSFRFPTFFIRLTLVQMPSTSRSALCTRTPPSPRSSFSFVKRKNAPFAATRPAVLRFEKLGRFYATSPRDPCRCNGDATLMGVAAREATPMHDGEARSIP